MIDIKMPDEKFDLMNLSDEELFSELKPEILNIIKSVKGFEDLTEQDIMLCEGGSNRRKAFGQDSNLYPHIVLDVAVKAYLQYEHFDLFIDPFSVKIAPHKYDPELIEDEKLTARFVDFMIKRFPDADYEDKRNKYYKWAETKSKIEEILLFF